MYLLTLNYEKYMKTSIQASTHFVQSYVSLEFKLDVSHCLKYVAL